MATVPVEVEQAEVALAGGSEVLGPEEAETLHVGCRRRATEPSRGQHGVALGRHQRRRGRTRTGSSTRRQPGRTEISVTGVRPGASRGTHRPPAAADPGRHAEAAGRAAADPAPGDPEFTAVAEAADSTPVPEARITWEVGDTSVAAFDPPPAPSPPAIPGHHAHGAAPRIRAGGLAAPPRRPACWASTGPAPASGPARQVMLAASLLDEAGKFDRARPPASSGAPTGPRSRP